MVEFYLNEAKLKVPPVNWDGVSIELNFDPERPEGVRQIDVTDFEFVGESAQIINDIRLKGLTTGVGIFEGIPFRIEVTRNGVVEIPFNGYLDASDGSLFSTNRITLKAVSSSSIDALNDKFDSFTFRHLFEDVGSITTNDFVSVPYILNSVPNYLEAVTATIGVYVMVREIIAAIQRIVEFIPELPVYYVFSTYIKLILYIIYLIFLIIALIKLVKQVILLLIQPIKYHSAMSVKTHFEKGAAYLGYSFQSDIFDTEPFKDAYIIPEKTYNPINKKEKQILGFTEPSIEQHGFYKGTFGDLIREAKKIWNAKIIIEGNTLKLVRVDYTGATSQYTLPAVTNNYDLRTAAFQLNTDEFNSNTLISFLTDSIDKNTMQDYLGTSYQVIIQPNRVNNGGMVLMKGLNEQRIGFALAKTKTELTVPEKIFDGFLKVFDVIAGVLVTIVNAIILVLNIVIAAVNDVLKKLASIGIKLNFQLPSIPYVDPPNFANKAKNRIGMMKIEKDIIGVNKICLLKIGSSALYNKIHPDNATVFSAKYLWENYHIVSSFLPTNDKPNGGQFFKYSFENVPFSFEDYEKVKENSSIFTSDGQEALIDSLKWNYQRLTASVKIRINKLYSNNFKVFYSGPDGR